MKGRKQKLKEYEEKYGDIPKNDQDRIKWMIDKYNLSPSKMQEIINKKRQMEESMKYNRFKIVLFEDPDGSKRPRFRLVNKNNYMKHAISNPSFIHVYSPNATEDNNYMHRLLEDELLYLENFINTPCRCIINSYFKTPSYMNITDIFIGEMGLHRNSNKPDWDNIGKKYSDMFNKNIWLDDSLVISGTVNKFYSILPRIEIFIEYLNCCTNKYQYKSIMNRCGIENNTVLHYLDKEGKLI